MGAECVLHAQKLTMTSLRNYVVGLRNTLDYKNLLTLTVHFIRLQTAWM